MKIQRDIWKILQKKLKSEKPLHVLSYYLSIKCEKDDKGYTTRAKKEVPHVMDGCAYVWVEGLDSRERFTRPKTMFNTKRERYW